MPVRWQSRLERPRDSEAMLPTALKNPIYMSRSLAWPSDLAHFAAG